ncbi:AIPR family protein [uncultured Brevundimonas sp.]|uniref:AIPR family protein n=1 Tax=uncultured Brevundimonas sp. TaxID=213418 RepID=UPI0030EC5611|tara:strand:- start:1702 stop:3543 length:1842 start_codon:yes stop_codon:yes gene_type:complete
MAKLTLRRSKPPVQPAKPASKSGTPAATDSPPWLSAFQARSDLAAFGDNALGLFALGLRFNIEDLLSVAADAITDGSDDKKCDIVFIDRDNEYAVVAQCYVSSRPKSEAPANKASDLNTAANWLLQRDLEELPERLKPSAEDLRKGIEDGGIRRVHFWYIHNLPQSTNVANELRTVEASATAALRHQFPHKKVDVSVLEVGSDQFLEWYNDTKSPILVNDDFSIVVDNGFEIREDSWSAFVTAMPLQFVRRAYQQHGVKLFSANVRDYLGSITSDANINHGIKKTAEHDPENFWVFNNGLTILVNSYEQGVKLRNSKVRFKFSGMSIVNGAQTTGAVASLDKAPPPTAKVAVRFIKTDDQELVYDVIRFNNSQNKVSASDFRSTDPIQRRLKENMQHIPQAEYEGGRRGGASDAIRRRPNLLSSYTVGQALAAVHGDATVAYNQRSDIWSSDTLYARYFNEQTTAQHIVFAYSLLKAVEVKKLELVQKSRDDAGGLTQGEEAQLTFFRRRGSTFLFVAALAASVEVFYGKRVPNLFKLSYGLKTSPAKAQQFWKDVVDKNAPLSIHLDDAFTYGLQNQERVRAAIARFRSLVEATAPAHSAAYKKLAGQMTTK